MALRSELRRSFGTSPMLALPLSIVVISAFFSSRAGYVAGVTFPLPLRKALSVSAASVGVA